MLGRLLPLVALGAGQGMTESSLGPTSEDPYALRGVNPLNLELIKLVSSKERAPVAAVQKLLDDGASPSSHGDYNYTALMWAIVRRAPDHVHTLLEAGADTGQCRIVVCGVIDPEADIGKQIGRQTVVCQ